MKTATSVIFAFTIVLIGIVSYGTEPTTATTQRVGTPLEASLKATALPTVHGSFICGEDDDYASQCDYCTACSQLQYVLVKVTGGTECQALGAQQNFLESHCGNCEFGLSVQKWQRQAGCID